MPAITYPQRQFHRNLRLLLTESDASTLHVPVCIRSAPGGDIVEVIACESPPVHTQSAELVLMPLETKPQNFHSILASFGQSVVGVLRIGVGRRAGNWEGHVRTGSDPFSSETEQVWSPVNDLYLPGPGICLDRPGEPANVPLTGRGSRTAGALGPGTYSRLSSLRIGIVGLGRLGSLGLQAASSLGVRQVTLVDMDRVELHNTGEGAPFAESDLGHPKVHVLENQLAVTHREMEVAAVAESVTHRHAINALAACHVIISAADAPGPRLLASAIATGYHRILLDIGTLIPRSEDRPKGSPTMGGDVRLILPGRCLLCLGGVVDEKSGGQTIRSFRRELEFYRERGQMGFDAERGGSLFSLNATVVGLAFRLLEDLAARRILGPVWKQIDFLPDGLTEIREPAIGGARDPRWCACHHSGWGDSAISAFTRLMERRGGPLSLSS